MCVCARACVRACVHNQLQSHSKHLMTPTQYSVQYFVYTLKKYNSHKQANSHSYHSVIYCVCFRGPWAPRSPGGSPASGGARTPWCWPGPSAGCSTWLVWGTAAQTACRGGETGRDASRSRGGVNDLTEWFIVNHSSIKFCIGTYPKRKA